ncbi:MAG TPA: helix-turn-helix transcriptional regulator [Pedobacter sp.]|jgi:transcriptional regulator with XRE-family HTH domain
MKEKHKEHYQLIGNNLRRIRLEKGLSQQDLANRCDVERAKISRIENASEDFMLSTLLELSIALEVPIDKLVKFDKN